MAALSEEAASAKGRSLCAEAQKKLDSFSFFNKAAKYEEASELFSKAGAQFKIAKMWQEAGDAYVKAAEQSDKCSNENEALNHYVQAAKCYKNVSVRDAVRYYDKVLAKYMENNKFSTAAKLYKEVAGMFEAEMKLTEAIDYYKRAAECYFSEDSHTSGNQCLLKVADYSAQQEDFKQAIDIYEKVSQNSLDNNLTKWSVTQYLFKAALCHFAMGAARGEISETIEALAKYKDMNAQFESSRECQFVTDLAASWDDQDMDKFTDVIYDYDQIHKLDSWKSGMLLGIKNRLKAMIDKIDDTTEDVDLR